MAFLMLLLLFLIIAMIIMVSRWFRPLICREVTGPPDVIFVLGGPEIERQEMAVQMSQELKHCKIYVSSGKEGIIKMAGLSHRLKHDRRATDTVTNFTTMIPVFRGEKYRHILIITSDYHFKRANMIGNLILMWYYDMHFSWKIAIKDENKESSNEFHTFDDLQLWNAETNFRIARDSIRIVLWLLIGVELSHVYTVISLKAKCN